MEPNEHIPVADFVAFGNTKPLREVSLLTGPFSLNILFNLVAW
jgi:hypothetical protein